MDFDRVGRLELFDDVFVGQIGQRVEPGVRCFIQQDVVNQPPGRFYNRSRRF